MRFTSACLLASMRLSLPHASVMGWDAIPGLGVTRNEEGTAIGSQAKWAFFFFKSGRLLRFWEWTFRLFSWGSGNNNRKIYFFLVFKSPSLSNFTIFFPSLFFWLRSAAEDVLSPSNFQPQQHEQWLMAGHTFPLYLRKKYPVNKMLCRLLQILRSVPVIEIWG